jgi:ribosomal protein S27AE
MEPTRMCGRCGGEMSAQGALYSAVRLVFRPQDTKFLTLQTGDVMTKAMMCRDCGMIEIIGDATKLRHLTGRGPAAPPPETEP